MDRSQAATQAGDKEQLPALTGLRFVAALLVLVAHACHTVMTISDNPFYLPVGSALSYVGMTIFFVMSGFVIHYNYAALFQVVPKATAVGTFLAARLARLGPLFFFCLLVAVAVTSLSSLFPRRAYLIPFFATMTQSWVFLEVAPNTILGTSFYPHAWSISTEIFFYLVYPLVVVVISRLKRLRTAGAAAVGWCGVSYALLYGVYASNGACLKWFIQWPVSDDAADGMWLCYLYYLAPLVRLPEFVLGCLTAQLFLVVNSRPASRYERYAGVLLTYLCVALVAAGPAWYYLCTFRNQGLLPPQPPWVIFLNHNFLLAPAVAVFLFCVVRYRTVVARALDWWPVVVLGEASYSIYLLHPWILDVFQAKAAYKYSGLVAGEWALRMVTAIAFCLCVSVGTYRAVEVPGRRWARAALAWLAGLGAPGRPTPANGWWRQPAFAAAVYATPCLGLAGGIYLYKHVTAPKQLIESGVGRIAAGKPAEALPFFDKAISLSPRNKEALFQRAMVRMVTGNAGGAAADLDRLLQHYPREPRAPLYRLNRGSAKLSAGDYPGADADFSQVVTAEPGCAVAYYWRGLARMHQARLADAEGDFVRAAEVDPTLHESHHNRGVIRRSLGDLPGAVAAFGDAIRAKPDWPVAYYERGMTRARLGDTAHVRPDIERALALDPAYADARRALDAMTH